MVHLQDQRLHTVWQQKASTKMMGLDFIITYKKGVENNAADALSRRPPSVQSFHISSLQPTWLEEILSSYTHDDKAIELLQQLSVQPDSKPKYQLLQGVIRYNNSIWIGHHPDRSGYTRTYSSAACFYYCSSVTAKPTSPKTTIVSP